MMRPQFIFLSMLMCGYTHMKHEVFYSKLNDSKQTPRKTKNFQNL